MRIPRPRRSRAVRKHHKARAGRRAGGSPQAAPPRPSRRPRARGRIARAASPSAGTSMQGKSCGRIPYRRRSGGQWRVGQRQDVGEKESRVGARGIRVTPEEGAAATPRRGQAARGQGRRRRRRRHTGQEGTQAGRGPMHSAAQGSKSPGAGGPAGGGRPCPHQVPTGGGMRAGKRKGGQKSEIGMAEE